MTLTLEEFRKWLQDKAWMYDVAHTDEDLGRRKAYEEVLEKLKEVKE
jgi:hypothetical protein